MAAIERRVSVKVRQGMFQRVPVWPGPLVCLVSPGCPVGQALLERRAVRVAVVGPNSTLKASLDERASPVR
jgi:hypothetical protein